MPIGFGEFLQSKRRENNLTQKELAKLLFVSESAVSKWEQNVAHPDISLLPKLSEILGVTEHELITASTDHELRKEKSQAKKWRTLSSVWDLFFYIAYGTTLLVCFICNLAIDKTLSWFFIVFSALALGFTFTNLPRFIKAYRLLLIPLSNYLALCLLLGVLAIYTNGNWFFIASLSVLVGLIIIFIPIFIAKYQIFNKIKKVNDFVSIAIDFVFLNILLIVIDGYTITNWYFNIALPIVGGCYLFVNLLLVIRFLNTNRLIKTSIVLALIDLLYIVPVFLKVKSSLVQEEIDQANILKANFSNWKVALENNIHCIIFLMIITCSLVFLIFGLIKRLKTKKHFIN